jgi:D-apiose dehydrogenase
VSDLRFAMIGTGFWARYQLAGWQELSGARCVALYNRTRSKAEALAREFGVPAVYDNAEELLAREQLDFVDIVTDVYTHRQFVELAAPKGLPIICQKPMAASLAEAEAMAATCKKAGVPLFIHENWRWQEPIRQFKRVLNEGSVGRVFRGRIQYSNSFPVFDNQAFLKELEEFILTDIGTHILDTARFLFGEAGRLFCQTSRVHADIKGEDVATVMMEMGDRATVVCEMSYASRMEHDRFPETFILAEGDKGSVELGPDFWIRVTTESGTLARRCPPPRYRWADPAYAGVHASIVSCNADMLRALQTGQRPETHADDNLKTLRLVFGAYESARAGQAVVPG